MKSMAKKLKLMSLFQELRGRAIVTNRKPAQPASGIYLMQLRALAGHNTLPRRRLTISVDLARAHPQPHPVKITHVRVAAEPAAAEPAQVEVAVTATPVSQVRPTRGQ
jgi:hypothetical protein